MDGQIKRQSAIRYVKRDGELEHSTKFFMASYIALLYVLKIWKRENYNLDDDDDGDGRPAGLSGDVALGLLSRKCANTTSW